jgi:hypothetical protein
MPHRPPLFRLVPALVLLLGVPACGGEPAPTERAPIEPDPEVLAWRQDVVPVLQTWCIDCHGGREPEASLDLERYAGSGEPPTGEALRAATELFERMASHVAEGLMPPPAPPVETVPVERGEDGALAAHTDPVAAAPPEAERLAFQAWFEGALARAWAKAPPDPGHVTVRRLNRYEYRNTVRDLLGVRFDVESALPPDDVGYGFDHIGDVLSMPPLLFEKYLAAAEAIAAEAIVVVPDEERRPLRTPGAELRATPKRGAPAGGIMVLFSNGVAAREVRLRLAGRYLVRVHAAGQQAGPEPARMEIRLGTRVLRSVEVRGPRDAPATFEVTARLDAGLHELGAAFVNDYYKPHPTDPKKSQDRNLHVHWLEIEGPLPGSEVPLATRHPLVFACEPGASEGAAGACLEETVRSLLRRAWRRPPTSAEVTRHLALVLRAQEAGESVGGSVQALLEAILVSPQFLFRLELEEEREAAAPATSSMMPLGDHALASRLSYFLWSSPPDAALGAHADAGTLRASLHSEVVRMLADEKARALTENFAVQWLELRRLDTAAPDVRQFKDFGEALRRDMRAETEALFRAIVDEDRSILDLLDAPFTYLNERLAAHYGIEGIQGPELRRVDVSGSARGGLLGQASILTLTSYPNRTSVVQRGKWLLEEILGAPPPPPPPGVGTLEQQSPEMLKLSLRERLAAHRADPDCAVCHDRMDNLGYGLENFDAVGRWRARDGMTPIDSHGVLPDGRTFDGPQALKRLLREDPGVPRCFAEKLLTYALGRGGEPSRTLWRRPAHAGSASRASSTPWWHRMPLR